MRAGGQRSVERMLTILEGSTFCICDERGDLRGGTAGLFAEHTRYLSRLELLLARYYGTVDATPPGGSQLVSDAPAGFPAWAGEIDLRGVPALGPTWDVCVQPGGRVAVEARA